MVARGVLLPCCLWLAAIVSAAPTSPPTEAARRPGAPGQTSVAVLPLHVDGELSPRWYQEAGARLVSGLSRGALRVDNADVAGECREPRCWAEAPSMAGANFVVRAALSVGDSRDYALSIDVMSARTGKVIASTAGSCELCGFEEAVAMIEARAAVLASEIARLGAVLPVLFFRSDPVGVVVSLDGDSYGPAPVLILAPAGPHEVKATLTGFLPQTFEIEAVDGVRKEVELRLVPELDDPLPPGRGLLIAGVATLSAGVAGVATGVTLLVLDGRPFRRRCEADAAGTCQFNYDTTVGGAVGLSVGGGAAIAGVVLLATGAVRAKRARRSTQAHLRPTVGPTGAGLRLRF